MAKQLYRISVRMQPESRASEGPELGLPLPARAMKEDQAVTPF